MDPQHRSAEQNGGGKNDATDDDPERHAAKRTPRGYSIFFNGYLVRRLRHLCEIGPLGPPGKRYRRGPDHVMRRKTLLVRGRSLGVHVARLVHGH
jgi:hypothetical protein